MGVVRLAALHAQLVSELRRRRRSDGGFALTTDGDSELEPTVVAALALGDERAARLVARRQRADGGFTEPDGRPAGPTDAALAALVLDAPAARRALRYAVSRPGMPLTGSSDPALRAGWSWAVDARSVVEPTSRVLLACKRIRPDDEATRTGALRLLRERQCADGGWNFGKATDKGSDLGAYAQTTAVALVAPQGEARELVLPGLRSLRERWASEPGGLTVAQTLLAFRLHAVRSQFEAATATLAALAGRPSFRERTLTVAWAALATAPEPTLESIRVRA